MSIANYKIHVVQSDGTIKDWDSYSETEKKKIAESLIKQAMDMLGYKPEEEDQLKKYL